MSVPQKRLQNNIVYIYLNVYISIDVAGVFLKSLYRDIKLFALEIRGLGRWKRVDLEKASSPDLDREHFLWKKLRFREEM